MATNTSADQTLKDDAVASAISEYTRRSKEHQEGQGAQKRIKRHHRRFRDQAKVDGKESKHPVSGVNAAPQHVHGNDWREMLALTAMDVSDISMMKAPAGTEHVDVKAYQMGVDSVEGVPSVSAAVYNLAKSRTVSTTSLKQDWIEQTFQKLECAKFIPTNRDPTKCGCGRLKERHPENLIPEKYEEKDEDQLQPHRRTSEKWCIRKHTMKSATDAHGTIEFQGGPHPYKAQYLRLSFDTDPADIMHLFENMWQITPPKLIITVHGGITNFDIQPKLARVFRKGLFKAAMTTGAWIITSGINAGVIKHVAAALDAQSTTPRARSKIVCIGITPWGMLKKTDDFVGMDKAVDYHPHSFSPKGKFAVLNNRHSYYLLVDNGTVGRYGADIILRKRLEAYIAQKQKLGGKGSRSVPVVCVVLEGGTCTIRTVLDYVTSIPRVPVVVCDGSGRASDMLAFAHRFVQEDGTLPEGVRPQLRNLVENVFGYNRRSADDLVDDLVTCARQRSLMTVFRLGETQKQDVDHAILTALLKGHNLSPSDQLSLALAWNRVDIARSDIFVLGQEWPTSALNNAMMEALINDRVDFVRLLLENGVSMSSFLTIGRLEELYNTDKGPTNTLYYIVRDVQRIRSGYRYKLPHIGLAIEKLMGNAYKSNYTKPEFLEKYSIFRNKYKEAVRKCHSVEELSRGSSFVNEPTTPYASPMGLRNGMVNQVNSGPPQIISTVASESVLAAAASGSRALSNHIYWRSKIRRDNPMSVSQMRPPNLSESLEDFDDNLFSSSDSRKGDFRYPFSELLLWAVLTKRQEMALCMWEHGEEAMAKALVACKLYKSLAKEAAEDYLEVEICKELKEYAEEFRTLSLDLLDTCYQQDDAQTLQLLTYELTQWSDETCLSLAVIVNNKQFLAHPCCQILLADLWHGGMRIRSNSNLKVIMGLVVPFFILALEFKSKEELALQPQTAAEHEDEVNYASSTSSSSSSDTDSSSSSDSSDSDFDKDDVRMKRRRNSSGSINSRSLPSALFQSIRRKAPHQQQVAPISPSSTPAANKEIDLEKGVVDPKKHPNYQQFSVQKNASEPHKSPALGVKGMAHVARMRPLKLQQKYYEFFAAPVTSFWTWTISFVVFMCCLTYVLLVKTPPEPAVVEWYLFCYVVVYLVEMMRKLVMSGPRTIRQKFSYYFSSFWNVETTMAILIFLLGFALRLRHDTAPVGRVILALDSVLWSIKLLDFMSIHPKLGPYITMAGKMVLQMRYVVTLLVMGLLTFGLPRQSITYPDEEWHWLLFRNIFYKPYFMLYGEVYADEIDTCGDQVWDAHMENGILIRDVEAEPCVTGNWVPPSLMVIFLLAGLLLFALLMATFNNIFEQTTKVAGHIWLFQSYRQVMEYEGTPFIPPPFTPVYYLWMIIRYIRHHSGCCRKKIRNKNQRLFDFSLKLFLESDQVEKLHDFEEECMDDYAREKEYKKNNSSEERIHKTAEKSELLLVRTNDLDTKVTVLKGNVRSMESRIEQLASRQDELLDGVRQMRDLILSAIPQSRRPMSPNPALGMTDEAEDRQDGSEFSPRELNATHLSDSSEDELPTNQEPSMTVHRATKTTTVCGNEGILGHQRKRNASVGGSLRSLHQNIVSSVAMSSSPVTSAGNRPTPPGSIRKQARDNDEYTSITDAIAVSVKVPVAQKLRPSGTEVDLMYEDDEEIQIQPMVIGNDTQDDDDEEISQDGDDEDDTSSGGARHLGGPLTPNSTLRRAKRSFVEKQNTVMRMCEEEINTRILEHRRDSSNSEELHTNTPISPTPTEMSRSVPF